MVPMAMELRVLLSVTAVAAAELTLRRRSLPDPRRVFTRGELRLENTYRHS
jgi:hypothetical protein